MNLLVEANPSRSQRLKAATASVHHALDRRIMNAGAFLDRERYGRFVQMQHAFHRNIDALYENADLRRLLPDLEDRRRFGQVAQDLGDLGVEPLAFDAPPTFGRDADIPAAFGWLYVAEGSNLGAAFLIKEAEKLGFTETMGARHLASHAEGRGKQWRTFTAALDALDLTEEENTRMIDAAEGAFQYVHALANRVFAEAR